MPEHHTENAHTGPGSFWTQAEWAEWSNTLAECLPEEYDGDAAQEAIIERALMDLAQQQREVLALIGEYADNATVPAPYTNERALYERLCAVFGIEPWFAEPSSPPASMDGGAGR